MEATTENLAKWIDELTGEIEQIKKKLGSGGGSTVTITPALESGTKVADYSIDDTSGSLYAPTPPLETKLFLDVANMGEAVSSTGQVSYTAVVDCAVYVYAAHVAANTTLHIKIDGVSVIQNGGAAERKYTMYTVYLKAGQTVTTTGATEGALAEDKGTKYAVIPLLAPTAPTQETRKTKNKKER